MQRAACVVLASALLAASFPAFVLAGAPPLGSGDQTLLEQADDSAALTFDRAIDFSGSFLSPQPVYTAEKDGRATKVRLYLARNGFGDGTNALYIGLRADAAHGYQACTLFQAVENGGPQEVRANFSAIPVGDASSVAFIEFDHPGSNCTLEAGVPYTLEVSYSAINPFQTGSGVLYTKGSGGTDFFIQVLGDAPAPPPLPTPPPIVSGTILAKSSDEAWDENGWDSATAYAYPIQLGSAISADGIVTHLVLPLSYAFDAPGYPMYFTLADAFGNSYDCRTEEKTLAEWGIFNDTQHNGFHFNRVTIGPFSGTECDTITRHLPVHGGDMHLRVLSSTGQNPGGNLGVPGHKSGSAVEVPFILYSATSTPACAQNCNSSVLFLPGIKGSALEEAGDRLWPPSILSEDIPRLALDASGNSVHDIRVAGVLGDFFGTDVYGGFASFMDGLVADGTIQEWEPMAYDWRFAPERILSDGIETTSGHKDMVREVETLAARSRTGKVTIVAHSMGGLMGKALIQALMEKNEGDLVDAFVMIGTPQLGTPQGAASLLHGDDEGILGGVLVDASDVRQIGLNLESAYTLLPSPRYIETVSDPVIAFDEGSSFTAPWRERWGVALDTPTEFEEFATGVGALRTDPSPFNLAVPEILNAGLLASAESRHEDYDTLTFPDSIRVVQVAGWGVPTVKTIVYKTKHLLFEGYDIMPTVEGDRTVVYPSALSSDLQESFFFDLAAYNSIPDKPNFEHRNLLSSDPIKELINSVIKKQEVEATNYILKEHPDISEIEQKLLLSTKSPITLSAYDSFGNFTGVDSPDSSGISFIKQGIPGSALLVAGGEQYLFLPKSGEYTIKFTGTGTGPATLETSVFKDDAASPIGAYSEIPIIPGMQGALILGDASPAVPPLQIDRNGDGQPDSYIASDGGTLSLKELMVNLKTAIQGLAVKEKLKGQLLNKAANIEAKIARQQLKQGAVLTKLQAQVAKKAAKGRIDAVAAATIAALLDDLIAQSALVPLDPALIRQLADQINAAAITAQLKANLLGKVARLQNLAAVNRSLDAATKLVVAKGAKGAIPDADVQNLLNLLDQIQSAI